jgi:hypothetical protein
MKVEGGVRKVTDRTKKVNDQIRKVTGRVEEVKDSAWKVNVKAKNKGIPRMGTGRSRRGLRKLIMVQGRLGAGPRRSNHWAWKIKGEGRDCQQC